MNSKCVLPGGLILPNQNTIQRAEARLNHLRNKSSFGNIVQRVTVDKHEPLVKRILKTK